MAGEAPIGGGTVVKTLEGAVMTLRINRPGAENRLNLAVLEGLCSGLSEAAARAEARVVVLRGTGDTFSCGGDLAEFAAGDAGAYREFGRRFARLHLAIEGLDKPVLAAVNGHARAGGLSLLAASDLAVARASAEFGMPEVRSGLWPMMAMVALNRALPPKRAFELYSTGEGFDAEEAKRLGLVNWIVPDADFEQAARRRAEGLAALPRSAVRIGRKAFREIAGLSSAAAFRHTAERLVELLTDPEVVRALAGRAREAERGTSGA